MYITPGLPKLTVLCLAICFHAIGFSSPNWYKSGYHSEGLWQVWDCGGYPDTKCIYSSIFEYDLKGKMLLSYSPEIYMYLLMQISINAF